MKCHTLAKNARRDRPVLKSIEDESGRGAGSSLEQFPLPSDEAQHHSEALIEVIRDAIDTAGGVIGFDRYMQLALYAPGLGYYSGGSRKFGAEGDFVTAPEISPLFSQCLARQCAQAMQAAKLDQLLEFGAGAGTMAADMLLQLESMQALPKTYLIIELSAELRQRQLETLTRKVPHLLERVQWIEHLPDSFSGVVVANEVVDAMPVRRLRRQAGRWLEQGVCWDGRRFAWQEMGEAQSGLSEALEELDANEGYRTEVCPLARDWIMELGDMLQKGLILLIDYGYSSREYYHPERRAGTLMCHYRHRAHDDPFVYPGLQDITAHVDFTALAEAALDAGLSVYGYTSQAMFLFGNGLESAMVDVDEPETQYRLAQQVKHLTLPTEMGERFKVMALGTGLAEVELMGFALNDMRGKL
ncbi:MAG: SAM-dependent methyltransferase [Gammaproteobacteria bacterium]|nr:SAM-dependent methyltransferase [Gammaproteobacteria bacterium]